MPEHFRKPLHGAVLPGIQATAVRQQWRARILLISCSLYLNQYIHVNIRNLKLLCSGKFEILQLLSAVFSCVLLFLCISDKEMNTTVVSYILKKDLKRKNVTIIACGV